MAKQILLTEKAHRDLQQVVRWTNRNKNIRPNYRRRSGPISGVSGSNTIRRAKIQATMIVDSATMTLNDAVKEGWLIIKLLDSSGTVIGSGENGKYKCWVRFDQSDDKVHVPFIADDEIVTLKIFSDWYLFSPSLENTILRAKAQEGSQAGGELSVKLLDSGGAVTGDAFDVYAFADKSMTDMTEFLPDIDTDDIVCVKYMSGSWFMDWTPLEIGTATDTVSSTAETVGGRLINNWITIFT